MRPTIHRLIDFAATLALIVLLLLPLFTQPRAARTTSQRAASSALTPANTP